MIVNMHLNTEAALDLLDGRLEIEQKTFWHRHIKNCDRCTQDLARWQQFRTDMQRSHLRSASENDLESAIRIFKLRVTRTGSTLRSIAAAIVFDSFLQPAMAGARGSSGGAAARQLVMRAEDFDIHIKIWGEPNHKRVLGQVLPRKGQDFVGTAAFHLLRSEERIASTRSDEMGEFEFTDVSEGEWSLQIDLPNLTVVGALKVQG
jgi:hypothetical protein